MAWLIGNFVDLQLVCCKLCISVECLERKADWTVGPIRRNDRRDTLERIEMLYSRSKTRFGAIALCLAASSLAVAGCSKKAADETANAPATDVATAPAETPAAPAAAAAPAADNTDTVSGVKLAAYTGDAAKGATDFITCKTCHAVEAGVNKIGPSLHGIVGRKAGSIAGFTYSAANKNSGITWTPEKLFQYLENPQRVVPGTKMAFAGFSDPQKRADVIAYLQSNK